MGDIFESERRYISMKTLLRILLAPVQFLLWIICGVCRILLQISTVLLAIMAILLVVAGVISVIYGNVAYGIAGIAIGVAVSPYGIPKLAALLLARLYCLRYWLSEAI
jgi:hypothetical protein